MTPQEFYSQFLPYARSVSERTGVDPRLVLAQAALETGYGKSAPNMNFFGIKSHGRKGGQTLQTSEFQNGQMVQQPASFRAYETPEQSFQDYADFLMSNPRYEGVRSAQGLQQQIEAMGKSGYATDPQYAAKLASIASNFDPSSAGIIAADTMAALGKQPKGILAPQATDDTESRTMTPQDEPRGLLGSLGIQKMEEGAAGETGQRFYERDSFKDTAALLAQGFGRMGIMGMEEIADQVAKQRTEAKARNKTMEAISKMGTPQSQAALQYIEAGGDPMGALKIAFEKPEEKTPFSSIGKLQADLSAGRINKDQYEVALQSMAPTGMSVEVDADGNVRFAQGAGVSGKPPSERQSTLALFGGLMAETMPEISRLESSESFDPAGLAEGLASRSGWLGNYLRTEEGQKYQGLARQWAEGVLRIQTGAAATEPEINRVMSTYFPVPGDTAETVQQKSKQRDAFARSLVRASGGTIEAPGGADTRSGIGADADAPKRLKYNPETGDFQ